MARLNEPAAPIETIESLKRKFMRQNRDIARANSTQSLRIRNLENETSRLLAENLGLREQILKLQNEAEDAQAQQLANHTGAVKSELEQKLLEIGALINSLGEDSSRRKKAPRSGKITRSSSGQSPNQKHWRDMCNSGEAEGGDGRLPPILENKSYPRRTLDQQEIAAMVSELALDSTDSPDIGPPPVSQFVDEDPVKIGLPLRQRKKDCEENPDLEPTLSSHLEQRKKRRHDSSVSETMSAPDQTLNARDTASTLKSGAKRKLSVREDEERDHIIKPVHDAAEEFKFTRVVSEERTRTKPGISAEKPILKATRELAIARGVPRDKQSATISTARKVLAPKSVNNSPKKNSRTQLVEDAKVAKPDQPRGPSGSERHREKRRAEAPVSVVSSETAPTFDTIKVQLEPETPAGLDSFSPPSSQQSTARAESRDTPPPGELGPGTEGQRPSRRARGAVSYAEPNLRDKMRRPTKELIDAVAADEKADRKSFIKQEEDIDSVAVKIKTEPEADEDWRRMPPASSTIENSPLSGKSFTGESLPSSITTHRKRRESILQQSASEVPRSSSANSVSALLASSRKTKADGKDKGLENVNVTSNARDIDIYDFRGSSPLTKGDSTREAVMIKDKEDKPISRSSRRNSHMSRDMNLISDSEASDIEASKKPEGLSTRRRQSSLGLRASSLKPGSVKGEAGDKALKKATSTTSMTGLSIDNRSDRIAARRRSMML